MPQCRHLKKKYFCTDYLFQLARTSKKINTSLFDCGLTLAELYDDLVEVELPVTLLLKYFRLGECTIRVTVLLEHLNCTFCIFGCTLLNNSLIFNLILLSFGKSCLLWLVHLSSSFQFILPCSLSDRRGYS